MATRERVAMMQYLDAEGKELGTKASPEATSIRFDFVNATGQDDDGKTTYTVVNSALVAFDSIGEKCFAAAAAHGLKQKLSDSYAGVKERGEDPYESFMSTLEQLQNDEWVQRGDGAGPRPSMVFEAVCLALVDMGKERNEELEAKVRATVADKDGRDRALANPQIKAIFARLQAEAAAERAQKAAEAAAKAAGAEGEEQKGLDLTDL